MRFVNVIGLAARLHYDQYDRAGLPYIGHCLRVANQMPMDSALYEAALLHDVVEDGCATLDDLAAAGVSPRALALVEILTRRPGETYPDYLARVKADPDAAQIKRADLADNLAGWRLTRLAAAEAGRLTMKYTQALEYLDA